MIAKLQVLPRLLSALVERLPEAVQRKRPAGQPFALVEHVWHLADLEREGFGTRLHRMLREAHPFLPDFPGDRIAEERAYATLDVALGIALFAQARATTLVRLEHLGDADRARGGFQEGLGPVKVSELPARILAHDLSHARELLDLLELVAPTDPAVGALESFIGDATPPRSREAMM